MAITRENTDVWNVNDVCLFVPTLFTWRTWRDVMATAEFCALSEGASKQEPWVGVSVRVCVC